jgi:hypothetical protein
MAKQNKKIIVCLFASKQKETLSFSITVKQQESSVKERKPEPFTIVKIFVSSSTSSELLLLLLEVVRAHRNVFPC